MEKSSVPPLERDINILIADKMRDAGLLVLQEVRLNPCEFDIVLFDPNSLRLATMEIKRTNWRAVLSQASRAKLYSHFSIAVLPASMRRVTRVEEFANRGLGLMFYEVADERIDLMMSNTPAMSTDINRRLKQLVYQQFHKRYGELIYA